MSDWSRLVESCKEAVGREVKDTWEVMEVVDELDAKVGKLERELSKSLPIDFIKWYSGMDEDKILTTHKRWLNEK
jgi:hypothetical protein